MKTRITQSYVTVPRAPVVERNLSTPESRAFWAEPPHAKKLAALPDWMRAGVSVRDHEGER